MDEAVVTRVVFVNIQNDNKETRTARSETEMARHFGEYYEGIDEGERFSDGL